MATTRIIECVVHAAFCEPQPVNQPASQSPTTPNAFASLTCCLNYARNENNDPHIEEGRRGQVIGLRLLVVRTHEELVGGVEPDGSEVREVGGAAGMRGEAGVHHVGKEKQHPSGETVSEADRGQNAFARSVWCSVMGCHVV